MSRKTSTFRGAAAAALCVFAIAPKTLGQDNPTPAANTDSPVSPSAIAAAKKDFETVKASRDAGLQRPADIPRVIVPEWPISAGSPSVTLKPKTKAPARDTKSTNWLVDAMEKQPGTRNAGNLTERDRQRRLDVGGREDEADPTAGSDADRLSERNERNDPKKRGEVGKPEIVNPLAAHLGEWMTREDYALLKPGLTRSLGATTGTKSGAAFGGAGSPANNLPTPGSDGMFNVTVPVQPISAPAAMRENPYLQPLAAPGFVTLPSNVKPKLEPLPPPRTANLPSFSPPAPIPPPQSKVPEFAKPPADEKYFKPLKRF